jgi:hypothetical protein
MLGRAVILDSKPVDGILDFRLGELTSHLSKITEFRIAEGMNKICGLDEYVVWRWGKIGMILGSYSPRL